MRSVRRGMVAAALAFPLAFGFAGVATAGESESDVKWAEYEASYALAGPHGAIAGDVSSEAGTAEYEGKHGKHGKHRADQDARHDKGKHKSKDKKVGWAEFEADGAAAGAAGAAAWEAESEAGYVEKG